MTGFVTRAADTLSNMAGWFRDTAEGRAIVRQAELTQARDVLAQRRTLAAHFEAAEATQIANMKQHESDRAPLQAAFEQMEAAFIAARERRDTCDRARRVAHCDESMTIDRLRGQLIASASPRIADFRTELREIVRDAHRTRRDSVSDKRIDGGMTLLWSNDASIRAFTEAANRIIVNDLGESGALLFEPLDDDALTARLEALRALLPAIESRPAKYTRVGQ